MTKIELELISDLDIYLFLMIQLEEVSKQKTCYSKQHLYKKST